MNSTPDDCRLYIRSYLTWPESCNMAVVFGMTPDYTLKHLYTASVIIRRFQRCLAAYAVVCRQMCEQRGIPFQIFVHPPNKRPSSSQYTLVDIEKPLQISHSYVFNHETRSLHAYVY